MLAKRRHLYLNDGNIVDTPLLIPSFSSKGFPYISGIIDTTKEVICDEILVSAYDIYYKIITPPFSFPSLIFLDSGGYEVSSDYDLSDESDKVHKPND